MGKINKGIEKLSIEYIDNWIRISGVSFYFYGQYSKSRNGKYILAWTDQNFEEMRGEFLLLEDNRIILDGNSQRPNDGKVANNGTFVLNDWLHSASEKLEGTFVAYNKKGKKLIEHYFSANLKCNGLADDGIFAACQTYNSNTSDSNVVACFNLTNGEMAWQKIPETRNADTFEFDTSQNVIYLLDNNFGKFRYTLAGDFLDNEIWYQARINHGSAFDLIEIADAKFKEVDKQASDKKLQDVLDIYLLAIKKGIAPYYVAKTHRRAGEIFELLGRFDKAINHYEQALKINPKVGVIKKLQKLAPEIRKQEKRPPFSTKLSENASVQLIKTGKSTSAGVAPRGIYAHIKHYDDACWYIKNSYLSGVEGGSANVSITNNIGTLTDSFEVNHLVFKANRASDSNYFVAVSYDLYLYLYAPNHKLISEQKISKKIEDRYDLKKVDVSNDGEIIAVAIQNELTIYNKKLQAVNVIKVPKKKITKSFQKMDYFVVLEGESSEDISTIQINDSNDMYFGTYSGRVFKFTKEGSQELVYECPGSIRDIKSKSHYLFVICDKYVDVVENGIIINRMYQIGSFSRIIWGDKAGLAVTKGMVKLFTLTGSPIAELIFIDSIADAYLSDNDLIVFTSKQSFVFNYSTS